MNKFSQLLYLASNWIFNGQLKMEARIRANTIVAAERECAETRGNIDYLKNILLQRKHWIQWSEAREIHLPLENGKLPRLTTYLSTLAKSTFLILDNVHNPGLPCSTWPVLFLNMLDSWQSLPAGKVFQMLGNVCWFQKHWNAFMQ